MRTIRIAVLGAGQWARARHLPALQALAGEAGRAAGIDLRVAGIWNRTAQRAVEAAQAFGLPRVYGSLDEVTDDRQLDCYTVLVHASALPGVIEALMRRPLPMFCEKPPGESHAAALALARRVQVPNLVGFNRRYMPIGRGFRQMVRELPDAYFAECHFYRSARQVKGFVGETGVHGINFMEFLLGPIREVATESLGDPDWVVRPRVCRVAFGSGVKAVIKFFPCCGSSVERYEVHGQELSLYLHVPMQYTTDHPGRIIVHRGGKVEQVIDDESRGPLAAEGFLDEYLEFFEAVAQGSGTASNFANASDTMRIAEAIEAPPEETRTT